MSFDAYEFLQRLFGLDVHADLPPEWVEEYGERAAILEYDGGLTRKDAETQALDEIQERRKDLIK